MHVLVGHVVVSYAPQVISAVQQAIHAVWQFVNSPSPYTGCRLITGC